MIACRKGELGSLSRAQHTLNIQPFCMLCYFALNSYRFKSLLVMSNLSNTMGEGGGGARGLYSSFAAPDTLFRR